MTMQSAPGGIWMRSFATLLVARMPRVSCDGRQDAQGRRSRRGSAIRRASRGLHGATLRAYARAPCSRPPCAKTVKSRMDSARGLIVFRLPREPGLAKARPERACSSLRANPDLLLATPTFQLHNHRPCAAHAANVSHRRSSQDRDVRGRLGPFRFGESPSISKTVLLKHCLTRVILAVATSHAHECV
jgi:hypothetical protein